MRKGGCGSRPTRAITGRPAAPTGSTRSETEGARRRTAKLFFRVPVGAEMCGPCFTPDSETLFVAVQHPGADGTDRYKGFERASTFADPATRWPDFDAEHAA